MKLLQWNIWNNEKIENIAKELKRFDADVACLQEVCVTENDFSVINKLRQVYPFVYLLLQNILQTEEYKVTRFCQNTNFAQNINVLFISDLANSIIMPAKGGYSFRQR